MKKKLFNTLVFSLFYVLTSFAQLHVDEDQDVGIGVEDTGDAKAKIENSSNTRSFDLKNDFVSNTDKFGITNLVTGGGDGTQYGISNTVFQSASFAGAIYGIHNTLHPAGDGNVHGLYFNIGEGGDGHKYGVIGYSYQNSTSSKNLTGIWNRLENKGSGISFGNTVSIQPVGTGIKKGYYAEVREGSFNTGTVSGVEALLFSASPQPSYGLKTQIVPSASSNGERYGVHSVIVPGGSGGTNYGVFSDIRGTSGCAGYFIGDVQVIGNVNWSSDEKLKKDIKDIGDCKEIIKRIKPRRYKFKKSKLYGNSEKEQFGFIAQELETILPELVSTIEHPNDDVSYTEEEGPDGELISIPVTSSLPPETYKAINYTALIPIMMQALKEQQTQIEQQQSQIEQQQKMIDKLINEVEKISKK